MIVSLAEFVRKYYEAIGFGIENEEELFQDKGEVVVLFRQIGKQKQLFSIASVENNCYVIQELNSNNQWVIVASQSIVLQ